MIIFSKKVLSVVLFPILGLSHLAFASEVNVQPENKKITHYANPQNLNSTMRNSASICTFFGGGTQCGCYKNYCWAYIKANSVSGDGWCYTQVLGVPHGQERWATCNSNSDCSWEMTCGNDVIHHGND